MTEFAQDMLIGFIIGFVVSGTIVMYHWNKED